MRNLTIIKDKELFSRLHLFWSVPIESVLIFLRDCEELDLPAGEVLISPDHENDSVFVLLSGLLEVRIGSVESPPLLSISVGECVGEMSIIDRENPSAYVVAVENSRLLVIKQETLWSMVNASHGVAKNLLIVLSSRLRVDNEMISDNKDILQQLKEVALIDALTGLNNRRWLDDKMDQVLERCIKDSTPFTVVMADIDHFKQYNDQHGHLNGDVALRTVAKVLRDSLRPNDMIARYGGEEFVILIPRAGSEGVFRMTERIRANVEKAKVTTMDGKPLPSLTVSFGLTEMKPGYDTYEKLLAAADKALYCAKEKGRNCVSV